MRLVVEPETLAVIRERGARLYIWPKASRCCSAWTYTLETAWARPDKKFQHVHEEAGIEVFATPGLIEPQELHLELGRRGRLHAYWNGQAWIG